MKVVELYILRRTVEVLVAALVWTLGIVWTTQVLARIDLVTDNGQSAFTFFEIATLILPSIIPIVVPFALALAIAQTLSVMNSDSELVVINAAGSSKMMIIRPILLLAVAASIFSFTVDNGVEPYARERGRHLVAAARADLLLSSSRKERSGKSMPASSFRSASGYQTANWAASSSPIHARRGSTSSITPRPAP